MMTEMNWLRRIKGRIIREKVRTEKNNRRAGGSRKSRRKDLKRRLL